MRLLSRLLAVLATTLALLVAATVPAQAADDYPWRTDTTRTADTYGFTKRQCVSFVAWRLAQRKHPLNNRTQRWGSAYNWDETARRLGYGISTRPVVGAVAHWNANEAGAYYTSGSTRPNGTMRAGSYGHVGYVQTVWPDGSVTVAHYNMNGARSYSTMRAKAPRYLYVSVATPR